MAEARDHLRDMALFVDLVAAMSFTRAAERLGMPKSSVSRRVARLEQAIGVRLLQSHHAAPGADRGRSRLLRALP